jgi:hypothetical protein
MFDARCLEEEIAEAQNDRLVFGIALAAVSEEG